MEAGVRSRLAAAEIPGIGRRLSEVGKVVNLELGAERGKLEIELGFPAATRYDELAQATLPPW